MSGKVWFITGASSGFGRLLTELALGKGDKVIATLRKPEVLSDLQSSFPPEQLLVVKLDVTIPQDVTEAFQKALATFGRIDVVFSNAGYILAGEAEGIPEEGARTLFDVNFWGSISVIKEAVRIMREVNNPAGGRVLVMSSMLSTVVVPTTGAYTSSKAALEGYTDTLATELDPEWNIKVTLLQCGFFQTSLASNYISAPVHPAYTKPTLPSNFARDKFANDAEGVFPGDPKKAVAKIYEMAGLEDPPMRLALGKDAVGRLRAKLSAMLVEIDKYEDWSDDLLRN